METGDSEINIKVATKKGYMPAKEGDGLVLNYIGRARGLVQNNMAPTLNCGQSCGVGVLVGDGKPIIAGDLHVSPFATANKVYSTEGVAPTLVCEHHGIASPKIEHTDKSEIVPNLSDGQVASMLTPGREDKRQCGNRYKTDGNAFTVTCQDKHGIIQKKSGKLRIRYLTPRECWRLQGFPDSAYDSAVAAGLSKTALYTQAGNSIAVPCLESIFKGIYVDKSFDKTKDITKWF